MKGDAIYVVVVADVDAQRLDVICGPETCGAIIRACEEVVAIRTPLEIPNGIVVSAIGDETSIGAQRPQPNCLVL